MISKKRDIKKRSLDWLWSAISTNNMQAIRIGDNSAIATDGIRLHAINADELPDDILSAFSSGTVAELIKKDDINASFFIDPKYLIDALRGFAFSEIVEITITGTAEKQSQRIVISNNSENVAVIMCAKGL